MSNAFVGAVTGSVFSPLHLIIFTAVAMALLALVVLAVRKAIRKLRSRSDAEPVEAS